MSIAMAMWKQIDTFHDAATHNKRSFRIYRKYIMLFLFSVELVTTGALQRVR